MSLLRLVIPLHDIKFTHFKEVSSLLSETPNNKIVKQDVEETKIKRDENIDLNGDTKHSVRKNEDTDFDGSTKHSDDSEEPKTAMDAKEQSSYSRTKYVEFDSDEDSTIDEVAEASDSKEAEWVITRSRSCTRKRSTRRPNYKDSSEEKSSSGEESMSSEKYSSQDSEGSSTWGRTESKTSPKSRSSRRRYVKKLKMDSLSEYEKMIEKNKAERMEFLKSIKIDEAKKDLFKVVDKVKMKKKKIKVKNYVVDMKKLPPLKRPSRTGSKMINYSEDTLYEKALQKVIEPKVMPPKMSFQQAFDSNDSYDSYEDYLQDIKIEEKKLKSNVFIYDKSVLEKLELNKPKFEPFKQKASHITALAWYPCPEKFILAAGCSIGTLSFSNIEAGSNSYVFKNHVKDIKHLKFNPFNHNQIVSSSADGSMRAGDMVKTVFNELYIAPEDTSCQDFDFLLTSSYLVAQDDGKVAIVDVRTNGKKSVKQLSCHDSSVKSLSVHPLNRNFFVTASSKGCVRLWDLRKLQEQPVADIEEVDQNVLSANFSPVSGSYILVSSTHSFSLFDSKSLSSDIWLRKKLVHKHNRYVGVKCKANWLPNSEHIFYISSNTEPRGIVMYNTSFDVFHTICHKDLQVLNHSNIFHPFRPALAVKRYQNVFILS